MTELESYCSVVATVCTASTYAQERESPDSSYRQSDLTKKVAVIGDVDERKLDRSLPRGDAAKKYRAVGLITCDKPDAKPSDDYISSGTGTLVENRRTVITVAHTFFHEDGSYITDVRKFCVFYVLDENGQRIRRVAIADMLTVNDTTAYGLGKGELSSSGSAKNTHNDWAVLKLAENIDAVTPFTVARDDHINLGDPIKMCAFSHDLDNPFAKRCLEGNYRDNGTTTAVMSRNGMILFHDMDTAGTSSGAPIFIDKSDLLSVVALNVGGSQARSSDGKCVSGINKYHVDQCSNYGIFFDSSFYEALEIFVQETGGSIYGRQKSKAAEFIGPKPADTNGQTGI
jgi:V8-like Glu-specific endopeptidase